MIFEKGKGGCDYDFSDFREAKYSLRIESVCDRLLCLFLARALESYQQSPEKNESKDFIERIDVEGYRRLQSATSQAHFFSRPGDLYSAEAVQGDAQTLRDTGEANKGVYHMIKSAIRVRTDPCRPPGELSIRQVVRFL